jgi:hypothetical protein
MAQHASIDKIRNARDSALAALEFSIQTIREIELVLRFNQIIRPIPVRIGRRAVLSRSAANYPSDSVH